MKKTYIQPNTEMIQVELQQMIAESQHLYQNDTVNSISDLESRGGSDWDDED